MGVRRCVALERWRWEVSNPGRLYLWWWVGVGALYPPSNIIPRTKNKADRTDQKPGYRRRLYWIPMGSRSGGRISIALRRSIGAVLRRADYSFPHTHIVSCVLQICYSAIWVRFRSSGASKNPPRRRGGAEARNICERRNQISPFPN